MSRFSIASLMSTSSDGYHDVWSASFANMRYAVPHKTSVTVESGFEANLPALAHLYLGDQDLWWVLLQYNGLIDPIHDVRVGVSLKIPDRTSLLSYLERTSAGLGSTAVFRI